MTRSTEMVTPSRALLSASPSDEEAQEQSYECTAKKLANQVGKAIFISFVGAFNCALFFGSITALTLAIQKEDDMSAVKTMAVTGAAVGAIVVPLLYTAYEIGKRPDPYFMDF